MLVGAAALALTALPVAACTAGDGTTTGPGGTVGPATPGTTVAPAATVRPGGTEPATAPRPFAGDFGPTDTAVTVPAGSRFRYTFVTSALGWWDPTVSGTAVQVGDAVGAGSGKAEQVELRAVHPGLAVVTFTYRGAEADRQPTPLAVAVTVT